MHLSGRWPTFPVLPSMPLLPLTLLFVIACAFIAPFDIVRHPRGTLRK